MYQFNGRVDFRKAAEGNGRQREEAIGAARIAFVCLHGGYQTAVCRVNLYNAIVVLSTPRVDVSGVTYVGEQGTLAIRHYRTWHRDAQHYTGKLEFNLFMQDEKKGDETRKSILRSVRYVRKQP